MKVIDLLNKIANGEEVPKKIKIGAYTFKFYSNQYSIKDIYNCIERYDTYLSSFNLNREVEIIEEDKEIEEIKQMYEDRDMYDFTFWESEFQTCTDLEKKIIDNIGLLRRKQEELIKAVNELKKGK